MSHENSSPSESELTPEHIPDEREVLDIIEHYAHEGEVVLKCEDEQGLYLIEVRVIDKENPSKYVQYEYMRQGSYPEGSSGRTNITKMFYENGGAVGGDELARFENGEWHKFELYQPEE